MFAAIVPMSIASVLGRLSTYLYMMLGMLCITFSAFSDAASPKASVPSNILKEVRVWKDPTKTRVVLDFTQAVRYQLTTAAEKDRLVVDLSNAIRQANLEKVDLKQSIVKAIRPTMRDQTLRLVFDLEKIDQVKHFTLLPNQQYSHRLVLDFITIAPSSAISHTPLLRAGKVTVAIDAGHGGEDPGARGRFGTYEKQVVLEIAKKLKNELQAMPGIRPVLTRDDDYFIELKERSRIAREKFQADLLISLHADAWHHADAKGASVFMLSSHGASSTLARHLAKQENRSDLIGGVELKGQTKMLQQVLADLAMSGTLEHSRRLGDMMIDSLKHVTDLHKAQVEQAGFLVLKSPDMPSILIETGFISNPSEERRLRDPHYQQQLVKAIAKAVDRYFSVYAPPDTYYAYAKKNSLRLHRVTEGETLKDIALRYRSDVRSLRRLNRLHSDKIKPGDLLNIPSL